MPSNPPSDEKHQTLRRLGSLHPHPERVVDELFQGSDFFDPHDLVQVKYEMLRRAREEGLQVTQTSAQFGLSRVSFYQALEVFEDSGLAGLVPKKRGPRGGHKLTEEIVAFVTGRRRDEPDATPARLAHDVLDRFGIKVHPRSIRRALSGGKKKP